MVCTLPPLMSFRPIFFQLTTTTAPLPLPPHQTPSPTPHHNHPTQQTLPPRPPKQHLRLHRTRHPRSLHPLRLLPLRTRIRTKPPFLLPRPRAQSPRSQMPQTGGQRTARCRGPRRQRFNTLHRVPRRRGTEAEFRSIGGQRRGGKASGDRGGFSIVFGRGEGGQERGG